MFGVIGGIIFGVVAVGAWISEDEREQKARSHARNTNSKYYFDKNGKMRWVRTGKKLTPDEIHNTFWNKEEAEKRKEYFKKEYWAVDNLLSGDIDDCVIEVFLTEEDAIKYKNNLLNRIEDICSVNPESYDNMMLDIKKKHITVGTYTQYRIDIMKNDSRNKHEFHYNF